MSKPVVYLEGMHGMGDCIHQRAILRQFKERYEVYLETSWPQIFWDMPEIKLVAKGTNLRTQVKNQKANPHGFTIAPAKADRWIKIFYKPDAVRRYGSVAEAMTASVGADITKIDFSFSARPEWIVAAEKLLSGNTENKPLLIYRPLIIRKEWGGCASRNPDHDAYFELFEKIRHKFYVISIADLVPKVEWLVSKPIQADLEFHEGQLTFETIAGLVHLSSLIYCSPGFAAVLGRSMGKAVVTVFGGYEESSSFKLGYGSYLGIDTVTPCNCFSHTHNCNKRIDIQKAHEDIERFINVNVT